MKWKPVVGYECKYCVSILGEVKNVITGKLKKQYNSGHGYKRVFLSGCGNKSDQYFVHRIVALAFLPNPENKTQVNHIDSNRSNNQISNLEWCTPKENIQHGVKAGNIDFTKGKKAIAVFKDGNEIGRYASAAECARKMNLFDSCIRSVICGCRTTHKGFTFKQL